MLFYSIFHIVRGLCNLQYIIPSTSSTVVDVSISTIGKMGNIFNPGSPQYRRSVVVASVVSCTVVTGHTLLMDFGKQEHIFTSVQQYMNKKLDNYFQITDKEIQDYVKSQEYQQGVNIR